MLNKILMTHGDRVRCYCSDTIYKNLPGDLNLHLKNAGDHFNTVLPIGLGPKQKVIQYVSMFQTFKCGLCVRLNKYYVNVACVRRLKNRIQSLICRLGLFEISLN